MLLVLMLRSDVMFVSTVLGLYSPPTLLLLPLPEHSN